MIIVQFNELFPEGHPLSLVELPDLRGKYMPFDNEGDLAPTKGAGAHVGGFTGCPKCGEWVLITLEQRHGQPIKCSCGEEFSLNDL